MIDRVNGNDYYDYTKLKMPTAADTTGSGEKFSLDYQRTDDSKEEKEEKEKISEEGVGKGFSGHGMRTMVQGGVHLELSDDGRKKEGTGESHTFGELFRTVRTWMTSFMHSVKGLLHRIWNDPVPAQEVVSTEEVPVEETDRLSEEYLDMNSDGTRKVEHPDIHKPGAFEQQHSTVERDNEIQKYLHSGDLEHVISLLTEDGQRTMAKNSSLLTYYDRTGRLTSLSASDQERILHGDRNVRKL